MVEKKQFKRILPAPPPTPAAARPRNPVSHHGVLDYESASRTPTTKPVTDALKRMSVFTGVPANATHSVTLFNDSAKSGEYKQWSAWIIERDVVTEWGRVGTNLQQNIKTYGSRARCIAEYEKLVASKRAKGYREHV